MIMKSYNDLLKQYERMYHQWWDDERTGRAERTRGSMRFPVARMAFNKYCKNIAIAMGKRLPDYEPDYKYQSFFGAFQEMNAKFPRSIYAGY